MEVLGIWTLIMSMAGVVMVSQVYPIDRRPYQRTRPCLFRACMISPLTRNPLALPHSTAALALNPKPAALQARKPAPNDEMDGLMFRANMPERGMIFTPSVPVGGSKRTFVKFSGTASLGSVSKIIAEAVLEAASCDTMTGVTGFRTGAAI